MIPTKLLKAIPAFLILFTGILQAQNNFHNNHSIDPYNPEYIPGEVLIRFNDDIQVQAEVKQNKNKNVVSTGIKSIDQFLAERNAVSIEKVFTQTRESYLQKMKNHQGFMLDYKGQKHKIAGLYNIYKVKFDKSQNAVNLAELISQDPAVQYAEPNYLIYSMELINKEQLTPELPLSAPDINGNGSNNRNTFPDDPLYLNGEQSYLDIIDAPAAWDSVTGDTTQVIAILDSGVDWDHPDLDDNIWTNWDEIPDNGIDDDFNGYTDDIMGWDYINNDKDPNDDNSHGTHVAGIAAAEGNNGTGICGVAWNSKIMPLKVLQSSGAGNMADLAEAINFASENGATVINMSLGSYAESLTVKDALYDAYITSVLVAAAGNNGLSLLDERYIPSANMFPACYPFVLGVQANAGFSNYDPSGPIEFWNIWWYNYEVKAPGYNILSTIPNGYRRYSGTSMAAPIVSGICALAKSHNDTLYTDFLWAKLIFGSENGLVNAFNTLTLDLDSIGPDLRFVESTLTDNLAGNDNDGKADAGEIVLIHFTLRNVGGHADSVWAKIMFSEFEDTTMATIMDSLSYLGDLSTWSTFDGADYPFIIKISDDVAHNREICFDYEISAMNAIDTITGQLIIKVEHGGELSGVMDSTLYLSNGSLWLVNNSFRVGSNGLLIIEPGTEIIISENVKINNRGVIQSFGKPDSMISITGPGTIDGSGQASFKYTKFQYFEGSLGTLGQGQMSFDMCKFNEINALYTPFTEGYGMFLPNDLILTNSVIENCYINNITSYGGNNFEIKYNIFRNIFMGNNTNRLQSGNLDFKHNVFIDFVNYRTYLGFSGESKLIANSYDQFGSINNNSFINFTKNCYVIETTTQQDIVSFPYNYWGTINNESIDDDIYDFWDESSLPLLNYEPKLIQPSPLGPGHVWKVEIDSIDPQDEYLEILGPGRYKFDVYFNRPMDTSIQPVLGFGVFEPYLQRIVDDSASWSSDSMVWSAYFDIGIETGDGINTIRVQNAVDTAGFEIPPEVGRFSFKIQAAGAQSLNFMANAGIGKVDLEWPPAETEDALGFNLYRFYNLTDSTFSDTLLINSALILDTLYTDYSVIPDTTYHYLYKIVGTDMAESDFSKLVSATPFTAANGDANGDLSVDVMDITSIVSYMLNQNPAPFIFDAADVNYDGEINVLDIIGCVQLIPGKKSVPLSRIVTISNEPEFYYFEKDQLLLESKGNIAGLQFELTGLQSDSDISDLRLFSLQHGFEFASAKVGDRYIGVLYSLSGRTLPEGDIPLFRFEGMNEFHFEVKEIFGGSLSGEKIPVLKKGQHVFYPVSDYELSVQPNPVKGSAIISWKLPEEAEVDLSIYDLHGRKIEKLLHQKLEAGSYENKWVVDNQRFPAGVYFCRMKIVNNNKEESSRSVKFIISK